VTSGKIRWLNKNRQYFSVGGGDGGSGGGGGGGIVSETAELL